MSHWIIGGLVGAVAGSVALVSYTEARRAQRDKERYQAGLAWCAEHHEAWGTPGGCSNTGEPKPYVGGEFYAEDMAAKNTGAVGGAILGILAAKALA
jgi:hypothetical protein